MKFRRLHLVSYILKLHLVHCVLLKYSLKYLLKLNRLNLRALNTKKSRSSQEFTLIRASLHWKMSRAYSLSHFLLPVRSTAEYVQV